MQIQTIAHRTSLDSLVFPVDVLLGTMCDYAITRRQDASVGADPSWPVYLFIQLRVSPAIIVRILEDILDRQEMPFRGRGRRTVVEWINTAVGLWCHEVELGSAGGGSGDACLPPWVGRLLARAEQALAELAASGRGGRPREELDVILNDTRRVHSHVDNYLRSSQQVPARFR